MENSKSFLICVGASAFLFPCVCSFSTLLGIRPLDTYYFSEDMIRCKDGSKSFSRDRLNDNFCDCFDGTDEPGTSACPRAKFYCRNAGSTPQFIFSSLVNDRFCGLQMLIGLEVLLVCFLVVLWIYHRHTTSRRRPLRWKHRCELAGVEGLHSSSESGHVNF